MKDVHIYGDLSDDLQSLEGQFPSIQVDFQRLLMFLRSRPFGLGERIDPADAALRDMAWTNLHVSGARAAAVLLYAAWQDANAYHIELYRLYTGAYWNTLSREEMKEEARKYAGSV